jgi:N-acetyl sugar amidotransferase
MDVSDPDITFDQNGYCSGCSTFLYRLSRFGYRAGISEPMWRRKVASIKGAVRNSQYDCLVGVSGGVDSSYVAYLCKQEGLRALLFHLDNGWDSDAAVYNIQALSENLGFDYYCHVIDWEEFREVQLAFLKAFSVDLEMPTDIAIHASICQVAKKFNIKHVIAGGNLATEGMLPPRWGYHRFKDMRMYKYIVEKYSAVSLNKVPTISFLDDVVYRFVYGLRFHYILNYFPFDMEIIKSRLINELGWRDYGGKHHESHITAFWQGYIMYEKFGMDYRRPTLSVQICNGTIDRSTALEVLAEKPYSPDLVGVSLDYIARKFKISASELIQFIDQKPKTYIDFPNNAAFLNFVYSSYARLKGALDSEY